MVMSQEVSPLELEVVVHLLPISSAIASVMGCEGNKRSSPDTSDSVRILPRRITLVCGNLRNAKVLGSGSNKSREQRGIVGRSSVNLDGGNDIRLDAAHQMTFDPIVLDPFLAVLHVKPA
jgi:hypothetical protein